MTSIEKASITSLLIVLGAVACGGSTKSDSDDTRALQALNDFIARDDRVEAVMISVSDGLTIVRKRAPGEPRHT